MFNLRAVQGTSKSIKKMYQLFTRKEGFKGVLKNVKKNCIICREEHPLSSDYDVILGKSGNHKTWPTITIGVNPRTVLSLHFPTHPLLGSVPYYPENR